MQKIERDAIVIEGLEVHANHGVLPEENVLGQKFVVSMRLYVDMARAGETDDIADAVNYAEVCAFANAFLREHTFKLVERAASALAGAVLERFPKVDALDLRLEKPWAPIGLPLSTVAVEIGRSR